MRRKLSTIVTAGLCAAFLVAGCGAGGSGGDKPAKLNPGTYTGQSQSAGEEDGGGYAIVRLTVDDKGAVDSLVFDTFQPNGELKLTAAHGAGRSYIAEGQDAEDLSEALEACETYVEQYMENNDIEEVDALTGATLSYNQFKEALTIALKRASE